MTLPNDTDDLLRLADLLGSEDAIWAPVRSWDGGSASNVYAARKEFPAGGVKWELTGRRVAERKAAQRVVEAATAAGWVERFNSGGQSVRVRLTEPTELFLRAACGLPGLKAAASLVREVAAYEYADAGERRDNPATWVPEHPKLTGGSDRRVAVEEQALPAIRRGWLVANSDGNGLVRYALGPVAVPTERPAEPAAEQRADVREAWAAALRRRLTELAVRDDANARELGCLPLPTGWGEVRKKKQQQTGGARRV